MKAKLFTAAFIAVALSAPLAGAQGVSSSDPAAVKAGAYKVESFHTQVRFTISHFGFTDYTGFFSGATGTLDLQPATLAASKLSVSVPVASVLTTVPVLDKELKGEQWFDTAKYPTATFVSTRVRATGKDTAEIDGDFTLHGVTRPVTLSARLIGSGTNPLDHAFTVGFQADGVIKRSDFGVKQYVPLVGDDVHLTIAGAFELQPAS